MQLIKTYAAIKESGRKFEVIFVSSDRYDHFYIFSFNLQNSYPNTGDVYYVYVVEQISAFIWESVSIIVLGTLKSIIEFHNNIWVVGRRKSISNPSLKRDDATSNY